METFSKYSKFVPYLYYLSVIIFWFTDVNREIGINAYPILLFGIPFLRQLIKPSRKLNFYFGITFVCLSSYMIMAYLSDMLNIINVSQSVKQFVLFSGLFIISNFIMALWMIKNSLNRNF